ncbi:MAG: hypothetical protein QXZ17_15975 [Nitrososphaerota archaeon]
MIEGFLEKLAEYMSKRYGMKYFFKKCAAAKPPVQSLDGKERTPEWEVEGNLPCLLGYSDGEVFIISTILYELEDILSDAIWDWFDKTILGFREMNHKARHEMLRREKEEVARKLTDRNTWGELKQKYGYVVAWLDYHDEVARQVTEKTGVKIVHRFNPESVNILGYFYAQFNWSGMSSEEKMKMVEKALDAIDMACREAGHPPNSEARRKFHEKFEEFRRQKGYI